MAKKSNPIIKRKGLRRIAPLHGSDARRTCWSISNDFSEGIPVTKDELIRIVKWERKITQHNQNQINRLRDALVKIGLMLTAVDSKYKPRHHEIFKVISDSLKHQNADSSQPAPKI